MSGFTINKCAVCGEASIGTLIGASKITRDITARRQAEAELQHINIEPQHFAYIVSHELNEPLRTISNFLRLLTLEMPKELTPDAQEYLGFAVNGARRMQQMLTDLLAYTQAGKSNGSPL